MTHLRADGEKPSLVDTSRVDTSRREGEAIDARLAFPNFMRSRRSFHPRHLSRGGLSDWRRKKVSTFIENHLADEVRLAALADLVDLSPSHFAHAFKRSFGVPPHRYHLHRRMERAKALLAEPKSTVTVVALEVGFAETSSFSTAFRKTTGIAPSEYRRSIG
jgi:AraC family transcriptional regulator